MVMLLTHSLSLVGHLQTTLPKEDVALNVLLLSVAIYVMFKFKNFHDSENLSNIILHGDAGFFLHLLQWDYMSFIFPIQFVSCWD